MVNKHKKGQAKELLAQKDLEKDGYRVIFRSRTIKQGPIFVGIDMADLFDVVAVKGDFGIKSWPEWKFISVKNHANPSKFLVHQEQIDSFKDNYWLQGMSFELWIYQRARWRGRGKNRKWVEAHWEKIMI